MTGMDAAVPSGPGDDRSRRGRPASTANSRRTWAIIAGGGTAGHVLPGLAIANALVAGGRDRDSILFLGSSRGIEHTLVPEAGFRLRALPGRGIKRSLSLDNVGAIAGLTAAFVQALAIVARQRPAVVVSLGGYASVPAALAASVLRVPIVVAEQNAVPGAANRLISRVAAACAVSFPDTELRRAVVTGNPVRPEVLAVDRANDRDCARRALGIDEGRVLVASFGGSLGARRINDAVVNAVERWRERGDLAVRHVIGERDWDAFAARREHLAALHAPDRVQYQPVRYEYDMPTVYAAADVMVCRAGATSVADLAVVGVPSVLVPLPHAPGDHQTANARVLADAGAAVLVPDSQLTGDRLVTEVDALLAEPGSLARMTQAAARVARPDAARRVAQLVEEHARKR